MCRVRTTGPLHTPKLLCSMIRTDHKNGTITRPMFYYCATAPAMFHAKKYMIDS